MKKIKNRFDTTVVSIVSFVFGIDKSEIFNNMLYRTLNEKGGKYKSLSKKRSEVIIRDVLNAELLLADKSICNNQKMLQIAKKYFDNTTLALLMSLRATKNYNLMENIKCIEGVLDIYRGDRMYIENDSSQDIPMKSACSRMLRDNYSMSYKEISSHIGKSGGQVKRYLNDFIDEDESLSGQIFENIRHHTRETQSKLLDYQNNKIFIRKSKRSKKYLMIDLDEAYNSPNRLKILDEDEVDEIFKDFDLEVLNS